MLAGICIFGQDGNIEYVNPILEEMFGEWKGRNCFEYFHHRSNTCDDCPIKDIQPKTAHVKEQFYEKIGKHYNVTTTLIYNPDGKISYLSIFNDITEHKRTDEEIIRLKNEAEILHLKKTQEIKNNEEQYESLFNGMIEGFALHEIICDGLGKPIDYRFLKINPAFEKLTGLSANEIVGRTVLEVLPGIETYWIETYGKVALTREPVRFEQYAAPLDKYYDVTAFSPMRGQFATIFLDITERKEAERQVLEQAALIDIAPSAIYVRDLENRLTLWNKGAERIYGWKKEEVIGKKTSELLYSPETIHKLSEAINRLLADGIWKGELTHKTKEGKNIIVDCFWALTKDTRKDISLILCVNTDITNKKRLEEQYLRSQRMQSVGTLAGGIAHDLNNILSPILLSVNYLRQRLTDEASTKIVDAIERSVNRGRDLVKQILSFSKGTTGEKLHIQIKYILNEIEKFIKETFPKNIEHILNIPKDLWVIVGDPTQIHQVLINICINARDAMSDGGKLEINAENLVIDEHYAKMHLDAMPGSYIVISITDNGSGMPPAIQERIFEPFFTTKEEGKGTGLGLATVLSIVKGHNGFINVYSEVGRGTQFKIYFPALEGRTIGEKDAEKFEIPRGNNELILLIDDEIPIREISKQTLENYGYQVMVASDGTEGVALFAEHKDEIAIVITDMMMPYMDGKMTIKALTRIKPNLKIIGMSGLMQNGRIFQEVESSNTLFIHKPFTTETLLIVIHQLLIK